MINIDIVKLKFILAQVAEGTYEWGDVYSFFRYDRQKALLRNVSPKHEMALLHFTEKFALHFIASSLPDNSVVLEVGSCFGGSASIFAHANKTLQIHAIDNFDDTFMYWHVDPGTAPNPFELAGEHSYWVPYQERKEKFLGTKPRSLENITDLVCNTYPNVTFYKGESPYNFDTPDLPQKLDQQIDLFFHDGSHRNPVLKDDIEFWFPKLKTNGIMLVHDYRPYVPKRFHKHICPDVEEVVNGMITEGKVRRLGSVRSVAILRKII